MIIIIGDGIAGFTLAAHLEKFGIDYLIFSKIHNNTNLLNNSYGLTIQEGDNILKFLDITFRKEDINFLLRFINIDKNADIVTSNFHSKGNYVVSRHILLEKLIQKINIDKLIQYKFLSIYDKYIVCDSKIYKYDLLIGADGINSDVRKYLNVNDVVQNTGYKFRIYRFIDTYFKNIKNDCIEYIDSENKIRVFIKPNGSNPTTAQIYYPQNADFVLQNLPIFIWNNLDKQNYYESLLNTTKKFDAPIGNIILLGDSYNAMTPYNGNGANTALINAHHLANIINSNKNDLTCVSVLFYSKIFDHTWKNVEASYKSFQTQFDNPTTKINTIIYDSENLFGNKKANLINNEPILSYKLHELHISELYLSGVGLNEFPKNINKLLFLKKLNLSDNLIKNIPDLSNLKDLKELYLRNNLIENIEGKNIDKLNLIILRLSYNNISKLNLTNNTLEELCLTGNKLTEYEQFCQNLTKLYISENNISNIKLLEKNKIKYLRIAFNPIRLSQFISRINKEIIKELKISLDQNDIFSKETYLNIRYGNQITIEDRKIKLIFKPYYGSLNPYDTNLLYSILLMDINKLKNINQYDNINELFKYLTLHLNGLLDLSDDILELLRKKIKINKSLFDYLYMHKINSNKSFTELFKLCNILYKNNKYYFQSDNHTGLPINEDSGRPYISDCKCLYSKCGKEFNTPEELISHFQTENIKYFHGYHLHHENYVNYIIKLFEDNKHFGKCPVYLCKYVGDLRAHYESLGIKPFWTPESKILFACEDYIKFDINVTDNCIICMYSKPNILFECLHKCVCNDCFVLLENNMKCCMCNVKSDYVLYLE